ncbi:MAG: hypothetical protein WA843_02970 [Candidatus Saccharimonadales bacterium]
MSETEDFNIPRSRIYGDYTRSDLKEQFPRLGHRARVTMKDVRLTFRDLACIGKDIGSLLLGALPEDVPVLNWLVDRYEIREGLTGVELDRYILEKNLGTEEFRQEIAAILPVTTE